MVIRIRFVVAADPRMPVPRQAGRIDGRMDAPMLAPLA